MNLSSKRLRNFWLAPLSQELIKRSKSSSPLILDYGCGLFDLASLLPDSFKVDGFDFNEKLIASIKPQTNSLISSSLASFESKHYNFIVLNSVLQYFKDPEEFVKFLEFCKKHLKPDGEIIVSDLIPHDYNPIKDAYRSISLSIQNLAFFSMISHLFKSSLIRSVNDLWKVSEEEVSLIAREAGFDFVVLEKNLTPSNLRWSCVLKPRLLKNTNN